MVIVGVEGVICFCCCVLIGFGRFGIVFGWCLKFFGLIGVYGQVIGFIGCFGCIDQWMIFVIIGVLVVVGIVEIGVVFEVNLIFLCDVSLFGIGCVVVFGIVVFDCVVVW